MSTELAARVSALAPTDGLHPTLLGGVSIHRRSGPTPLGPRVLAPGFGVILSGGKRFARGGGSFDYRAADWLVTPAPVATTCTVTEASPESPYLALLVKLDARRVAEAMAEVEPGEPGARASLLDAPLAPPAPPAKSRLDDALGDVISRLVRVLDSPKDARVVGPLLERELLHRLLESDQRAGLRSLAFADRAALKVLGEIDARFAERLTMADLARSVHLGVSSLHHRFKAATGTSPLQYLKRVRLREARRLMVEEGFDAASAAYAVGYASTSQFSREYRRAYALPPKKDVARLAGLGTVAPG